MQEAVEKETNMPNTSPFGDGTASQKIVGILKREFAT
jgi:UDP-N-acetylglucosamine 2-epimerase